MRGLVDAHCHLALAGGIPGLQRSGLAFDAGLGSHMAATVVAVTNLPSQWRVLRKASDPRVTWALGLHPGERHGETAVAEFLDLVGACRAVGEIGLDGTPGCATPLGRQRDELSTLLGDDGVRRRYVSLHSRRAAGPILEHLEEARLPAPCLHWFTGTPKQAARAADLGAWFSVNASMARSPKTLEAIPPTRVLLETDAPFGGRGGRRAPGDLSGALDLLADTWVAPRDRVVDTILENQRALATRIAESPF